MMLLKPDPETLEHRAQSRARSMISSAKKSAYRRSIDFYLDTPEFLSDLTVRLVRGVCEVTGVVLDLRRPPLISHATPSLDRIDSSGAYVPENVRLVCWGMNVALNSWGEDALWGIFKAWAKRRGFDLCPCHGSSE